MLILKHPKSGDMPEIKLETAEELHLFIFLTSYIEKAGYYWTMKDVTTVVISAYPLDQE